MKKMLLALSVVLAGCWGTPSLDTQTFRLQSLSEDAALQIIDPYVFGDRPNAPGAMSAIQGVLTVRETADNLAKIRRVLEEFDRPRLSVTLRFQVIVADGATTTDSSIAEVEAELRKLFRFRGYQLSAEGVITGRERSEVDQRMFDQRGSAQRGDSIVFSSYEVYARIGSVSGEADNRAVELIEVALLADGMRLFGASVVLGIGNTIVLGTMQLPNNQALILAVRAEVAPD